MILAKYGCPKGLNQKLDHINTNLTKLDLIYEKVNTIEDTITSMQRYVEMAMITAEEAKHETINSKKQFIDLQQAYEKVQVETVFIQVKLDSIFEKQLAMECQSRRSNLNLDNVPEKFNEKPHETQIIFRDVLKRKMKCGYARQVNVERCHRVGKKVDGKAGTIIAKFSFFEDREDIWQHRSILKRSNIFLREDFPIEYENRHRQLQHIVNAARKDE